jgi:hypothetical protein
VTVKDFNRFLPTSRLSEVLVPQIHMFPFFVRGSSFLFPVFSFVRLCFFLPILILAVFALVHGAVLLLSADCP